MKTMQSKREIELGKKGWWWWWSEMNRSSSDTVCWQAKRQNQIENQFFRIAVAVTDNSWARRGEQEKIGVYVECRNGGKLSETVSWTASVFRLEKDTEAISIYRCLGFSVPSPAYRRPPRGNQMLSRACCCCVYNASAHVRTSKSEN